MKATIKKLATGTIEYEYEGDSLSILKWLAYQIPSQSWKPDLINSDGEWMQSVDGVWSVEITGEGDDAIEVEAVEVAPPEETEEPPATTRRRGK